YTAVDGLNTYYIRRGAGPALVLVHGQSPGSCAEVVWAENVEYFARPASASTRWIRRASAVPTTPRIFPLKLASLMPGPSSPRCRWIGMRSGEPQMAPTSQPELPSPIHG